MEVTKDCVAVYKLQAWDSNSGEYVDFSTFLDELAAATSTGVLRSEFVFNPETADLRIEAANIDLEDWTSYLSHSPSGRRLLQTSDTSSKMHFRVLAIVPTSTVAGPNNED
jgi:hypothetical protein